MAFLKEFIRFAIRNPAAGLPLLQGIGSPHIAPLMARLLSGRGPYRPQALAWLERWPEIAAAGLFPAALGTDLKARKEAIGALQRLIQLGKKSQLLSVAANSGLLKPVRQLLEADPLSFRPSRFKARPEWWDGAKLVAPPGHTHEYGSTSHTDLL
jgi:hypothetical protein